MYSQFFKKLLIPCLGILLFSGCAFQSKKIISLSETELSYQDTKDNVELLVRATAQGDKKGYFDQYTPIHLQIKNKSKKAYLLNSKNISLNIASKKELDKKIPQVIGSYFIPATVFFAAGIIFWWQVCLPLAAISTIGSFFLGEKHKKKSAKQLANITLDSSEKLIIKPYSKINKLIFVRTKNYSPKFNLKLIDTQKSSDEILFNVWITAKSNFTYKFT